MRQKTKQESPYAKCDNPQKAYFEEIHDAYNAHYYDASSMRFREEFIYDPLFEGLDFNEKDVLELASGAGANAQAIQKRFPRARITGCDISESACADFRKKIGCPSFQTDLTVPIESPKTYDILVVFGGIHHCVSNLPVVLENVCKLLRPGGYFLMFEPNNQYFLEGIRKFWYKHDAYFEADTEGALAHDDLLNLANTGGGGG
jgi:SAM-dependent methyltransferase